MRYNSFLHIFPEQCAKYLHDKFRMHSDLTVRELMVILKRIGIKTIKILNNGKLYNVFSKRDIDGIQDFEFLNNLHEYRRIKQIKDEWSKESLIDYTPELSNMQNASDELLHQDDVYYTNESQKIIKYNNMKKDNKKALYESIMASVAKEVKKALNERARNYNDIYFFNAGQIPPFPSKELNSIIRKFIIINIETFETFSFGFANEDIDVWASAISSKGEKYQTYYIPGHRNTAEHMKNMIPGESFNLKNLHILCVA